MHATPNLSRFNKLNRREFVRVGSLTAFGLSLAQLSLPRSCATESAPKVKPAKACILIWLDGGPSHIDTFDPKPNAPAEVRGPFASIATAIPGIQISELFPQLASRLNRCTLIRSLTSPLGEHNLGTQYLLTGYKPSSVLKYPSWPSIIDYQNYQSHRLATDTPSTFQTNLPRSVAIPQFSVGGADISPQGFLPTQFAPFSVLQDPAQADFAVPNLSLPPNLNSERLARRQNFREWLDRESNTAGQGEDQQTHDGLARQAFELLQSSNAQRAFNLSLETAATRTRYGSRTIGQSCLLARRLIEHGVPLVSVIDKGWDTHADVINRLRSGFNGAKVPVGLGPSLDQALSALLDDLQNSGRLDETLVVVMGEFGRTPKWNSAGGRDHWPRAFSVLLAGGPVQRGQVIGSSDRHGESPLDQPVTPADLTHSIFTALGIEPTSLLQSPDGRPIRITDDASRAIPGLFI